MKKTIGFWDLVFMNIAALFGVRWMAVAAGYGAGSVFMWLLAAFLFFVPSALVASELAATYPRQGGMFIWVKEAYGEKWGYMVSWLNWTAKIFWYPGYLTFITVSSAYVIGKPELAENKLFVIPMVLGVFWFITIVNLKGLSLGKWFSNIGGLLGSIVPSVLLIGLGFASVFIYKNPIATSYTLSNLIPDFRDSSNISMLSSLMFAMAGVETTAAFAGEVKDAQKVFPRAIFTSAALVAGLYIIGTMSITFMMTPDKIGAASGLMEAFRLIAEKLGIGGWFIKFIAVLVVVSGFGGLSVYLMSPTTMLFESVKQGVFPEFLTKENKYGVPQNALIVQAIGVSIIMLLMVLLPSVNAIYSILVTMTALTSLIPYVLLYVSFLSLRKNRPNEERPFKVSKNPSVAKTVAIVGLLCCLLGMALAFIPSDEYSTITQKLIYEIEIIGGGFFVSWLGILIWNRYEKKLTKSI
ncbi:Amino acid transporter [Caminicella sporogenes DSM 14501]|uniref:Amino acid transporter n=1 Tax=Caminicella sporogenes DSM 14501 TaxID=1121266 RepID=A0A1M6Q7W4_9FIRM|nr:amino acid permease [Caminicella sporogenes]RKD23608.1 amino acid permease [Caminicella sporogenes]SHK16240.1 Amino acid transporter [Caminicella sporogenes DSM 14501]